MTALRGAVAAVKDLLRPWKHRALTAIGRELVFTPDVDVATECHGTEYGGFAILRESLHRDAVVLSCGIGEDASFDLGLIEKYGCTVHAYDPTPKSVAWVKRSIHDARFVLHEMAIASADGTLRLYLPKRTDFVSASLQPGEHTSQEYVDVPARRIATIVQSLGAGRVDVLKLDIEGAEYGVLADLLRESSAIYPDQLALEFHHFYPEFGIRATRDAVSLLRRSGYRLCWVSPSQHELLFVREAVLAAQRSKGGAAPADTVRPSVP